ncbi:hypothetical protein ACJX0J_040038, partial [Zea mays]
MNVCHLFILWLEIYDMLGSVNTTSRRLQHVVFTQIPFPRDSNLAMNVQLKIAID